MVNDSASIIAAGTIIVGRIVADGDLAVLGHVEGTVEAGGRLTIGDGAMVKCTGADISAAAVEISGAVAGSVQASERLVLEQGARVVGDLVSPSIAIRPGALLRGHVQTAAAPGAKPAARATSVRRAAPVRAARPQDSEAAAPPKPAAQSQPAEAAAPPPAAPEPVLPAAGKRGKKAAAAKAKAKAAAPEPAMPALKTRTKKATRRSRAS